MMMPLRHFRRTSLDEAFIQKAKSFCRTLPTLTFPLSFTIGDRSHCVTSRSHVLSCLSRSSTPTCTRLIVSVPLFFIRVQGTRIPVTPQLVADVLRVLRIEFPDYHSCECLRIVSRDELMSAFCECPTVWGECLFTAFRPLARGPRFMNMVMTLFCIHFLTITPLQSLVLDFCCLFLSILL